MELVRQLISITRTDYYLNIFCQTELEENSSIDECTDYTISQIGIHFKPCSYIKVNQNGNLYMRKKGNILSINANINREHS